MESHIMAERIANAIMMDNSYKGYFLIVEGVKDFKLYSKFIEKKNVKIKEAFGNEKVKSVLEILTKRGFINKIGIIDSDFNKLLNINFEIDELFITDCHDIEVMIIKTQALDHVLSLYCSSKKITEFENETKLTIRETIFNLGREVGYLKLANKIYDLGLIFKPSSAEGNQIKYRDFIDDSNLKFKGTEKLIESIMNYSRSKSKSLKSKEIIEEKLNDISSREYDLDHLVNGHDLSNILFMLIKKVFSSSNRMLIDFNSIEDSLILAYEYEEFKQTNLYSDIKIFEEHNQIQLLRI